MSEQQWKRLDVIARLGRSELTVVEAAQVLGLSERHLRNLRRSVESRGAAGVVHGNTGRAPSNRTPEELRKRVVELWRGKYSGFNDQHFTEKLAQVEGIEVSRATVQRLLRAAGIGPARRRRPPRHRRRRDRKAQAGMMLQWDGSPHDWLEGRGPMLCLMGAVDDATSELLPGAHFVAHECSAGYLRVLRDIVAQKGIPLSIYMDRHGTLKRNDDHWTLEEELKGEQEPTQVLRSLRELGIEAIYALSPQAKGRVERRWGVLQDRLVSELRLVKAKTAVEADAVLERMRPGFNERFAVAAAEAISAWRPVRRGVDLDRACGFRYQAAVLNDNTVRLSGMVIDIPPGPRKRSYAHARVDVRQLLDGSWRVYFEDRVIAEAPRTEIGELRVKRRKRRSAADKAFRKSMQRVAVSLP